MITHIHHNLMESLSPSFYEMNTKSKQKQSNEENEEEEEKKHN